VLGPVGLCLRDDEMRTAVDEVTPTGLGALNVAMWLVGFFAIGAVGRLAVGGDGRVWFIGALAVMTVIAKLWPWTRARVESRLREPAR
jgi:hypothetical protein